MSENTTKTYYRISQEDYEKVEKIIKNSKLKVARKETDGEQKEGVNLIVIPKDTYNLKNILRDNNIDIIQEVIGNIGWVDIKENPSNEYNAKWNGLKEFIKKNQDTYPYIAFKKADGYQVYIDSNCPIKIDGIKVERKVNNATKCYITVSRKDVKDTKPNAFSDKELFPDLEKNLRYNPDKASVNVTVPIDRIKEALSALEVNGVVALKGFIANSAWNNIKSSAKAYEISLEGLNDFLKQNDGKFKFNSFFEKNTVQLFVEPSCNIKINGNEIKNKYFEELKTVGYLTVSKQDYDLVKGVFTNEISDTSITTGSSKSSVNIKIPIESYDKAKELLQKNNVLILKNSLVNTNWNDIKSNAKAFETDIKGLQEFMSKNNNTFKFTAYVNGEKATIYVEPSCSIKIEGKQIENKYNQQAKSMKDINKNVESYKENNSTNKTEKSDDKKVEEVR